MNVCDVPIFYPLASVIRVGSVYCPTPTRLTHIPPRLTQSSHPTRLRSMPRTLYTMPRIKEIRHTQTPHKFH